eukprot:1445408-Pyramimonas_sp.AAC.1
MSTNPRLSSAVRCAAIDRSVMKAHLRCAIPCKRMPCCAGCLPCHAEPCYAVSRCSAACCTIQRSAV